MFKKKLAVYTEATRIFKNRTEAGRAVAQLLVKEGYAERQPLVLGLLRGGIVIASEIARLLNGDLDFVLAKKIGAPGHDEFAIGAVDEEGHVFLNEAVVQRLQIPQGYVASEKERLAADMARRSARLRGQHAVVPLSQRIVIVCDDGVATGSTLLAALKVIRAGDPAEIVVALPVAPPEGMEPLLEIADRVVCLETPKNFSAVGQFYEAFPQLTDEEVEKILLAANKESAL